MPPHDVPQRVRDLLVAALDGTEQAGAAAYLDATPLAGGRFQAFIDRRPGANWTHEARTLLIDPATGEVSATLADRPPAFGPLPPGWQLAWKAPSVEAWQLLPGSAPTESAPAQTEPAPGHLTTKED